jgi:hypothetical protein
MAITVSGTSITFNDATVQTTAATAGVTSVNSQTGAVVTTSLDAIGSTSVFIYAGNTNLSTGGTTAGSSLRYDATLYTNTNGSPPFTGRVIANNNSSYPPSQPAASGGGGGTALSGTWRKMSSGANYAESGPPCNRDYSWYNQLYVRVS